MFGNPHRAEHSSILRRRSQESRWMNARADVEANNKTRHITHWEQNTQKAIGRNTLTNLARSQKAMDETKLLERRERLAKVLETEKQQFRQELAALQETSQQRADRMISRAKQLKATREARTQESVQKTYERQWRMGCDDLRTIESDRFRVHCDEEIAQQRKEKATRKELERLEEQRWANLWENQRRTTIKKETKTRQDKQAATHDNRNALLAQMSEARRQRADQSRKNARGRAVFQAQMERDAEDARIEQARVISEKKAIQAETKVFNQLAIDARREAMQRERAEEKVFLEKQRKALEAENEQKDANKAHKRREIMQFRSFLASQRESDRGREAEIDKLIQQDLGRANRKRDLQHQREELARQRLREGVRETLSHQLVEKAQRKVLENEKTRREMIEMKDQTKRELELQALEEKQERDRALAHRKDLEKQIQQGRMKKNLATARVALEKEFSEQAEAQYRMFLARERKETQQGHVKRSHGLKDSYITKHAQATAPARGYGF